MKEIERPDWENLYRINSNAEQPWYFFNQWFDKECGRVNRDIREGVEVYDNGNVWHKADESNPKWCTHKALLIDITEIKQEPRCPHCDGVLDADNS